MLTRILHPSEKLCAFFEQLDRGMTWMGAQAGITLTIMICRQYNVYQGKGEPYPYETTHQRR